MSPCPTILLAAAALSAAAAGCGPSAASASGQVRLNGRPVTRGAVTVFGADGLPRTAAIGRDGGYAVPDLVPGPATVTVSSPNPVTARPASPKPLAVGGPPLPPAPARPAAPPPTPEEVRAWFPIPAHYAQPHSSGLAFEVRPGANRHDIDLR